MSIELSVTANCSFENQDHFRYKVNAFCTARSIYVGLSSFARMSEGLSKGNLRMPPVASARFCNSANGTHRSWFGSRCLPL